MTKDEAMRMALDALDYVGYVYTTEKENQEVEQAIEALRTALAHPEKEWVGLTAQEKKGIFDACEPDERSYVIAMTEALLKDKNHG